MPVFVDLGNTRLKWVADAAGAEIARGALAHAGVLPDGLEAQWAALPATADVYVASVASCAIDASLDDLAQRRFSRAAHFVRSPAEALGIRNAYAEPARFGVDRFLGLAALHAAHARAQVLVGVGTAMTLDALDADGTHLGGWILPSPALMRAAVLARTARVDAAEGALVDFATDTADALHSGSLQAARGTVERFAANVACALQTWPAVVLTGGGADELSALLPGAERAPDLVVAGLRLWAASAASDFARASQ